MSIYNFYHCYCYLLYYFYFITIAVICIIIIIIIISFFLFIYFYFVQFIHIKQKQIRNSQTKILKIYLIMWTPVNQPISLIYHSVLQCSLQTYEIHYGRRKLLNSLDIELFCGCEERRVRAICCTCWTIIMCLCTRQYRA